MPKPKTHITATPHSHTQRWLLAHDIRDPQRLGRVWRYLRKEGIRLQYSVYLLAGSRMQIDKIMQNLLQMIDEKVDDVRIYPLTENTRIWGLGKQFSDDGNTLCDAFIDKLIMTETSPESDEKLMDKLSF